MKKYLSEYRVAFVFMVRRIFTHPLYREMWELLRDAIPPLVGVLLALFYVLSFPISLPVLAAVKVASDRRDERRAAEWLKRRSAK